MTETPLKTVAIKSTAWYSVTRLAMQAVYWSTAIVVARWLTPADYGLFAMAITIIGFLESFQELGLGTAIIQRQDLERRQINAIFWFVTSASLVLALTTVLAAGLVADYYQEPRLTPMLRVLSLIYLITAVAIVPSCLLVKKIDFRRRSIAEGSGAVAAAVASFTLAIFGFGVWALIAGYFARVTTFAAGVFLLSGWFPGWDVSFARFRDVLAYGGRMTGSFLAMALSPALNIAIIGRLLGGAAVGLYSMADGLSTAPHRISTNLLNQISMPLFSKLQNDEPALRRYFLKLSKYMALIAFPVQVAIALMAGDIVDVVLTSRWADVVPLLSLFSLGMVIHMLSVPAGPLLAARGRAKTLMRNSWFSTIAVGAACAVGTPWGLTGLGVAWLVAFAAPRVHLLALGLRDIDQPVGEYLRAIMTPFLATTALAAVVWPIQLATAHWGAPERLAVSAAVALLAYLAVLVAADRGLTLEARHIIHTLVTPVQA